MSMRSSIPSDMYPSSTTDSVGNVSIHRPGEDADSRTGNASIHDIHRAMTISLIGNSSDSDFATQACTDEIAHFFRCQTQPEEVHQFGYGSLAGHVTA